MPLGGLGTGSVAIHADGSLRQWQIFNQVNHDAYVPHSFFAIRAASGGRVCSRVLIDPSLWDLPFKPAPLVTDHLVPGELRRLLEALPGVDSTEMVAGYPIAEILYRCDELPVQVSVEAFSPMIPLNSRDSGLPAAVFIFRLSNPSGEAVEVSLLGALQNAVGYDGVAEIVGTSCPLYGGNANAITLGGGWGLAELSNQRLDPDHERWGTMALAAACDGAVLGTAEWTDPEALWRQFSAKSIAGPSTAGPSPVGETINCALQATVHIPPGEEREIVFVLAWHFPNRIVNWSQAGFGVPDDGSKLRIGNWYATWLRSAGEVARYVLDNLPRLGAETEKFRRALLDTTLPPEIMDAVSSQISTPRTPTCFRTEDGRFYGFEGCCGASTGCNIGGCCPLNCTHVWNYELALARLYPDLERTMRETDLFEQMSSTGGIPHRTVLPLWLPRWGSEHRDEEGDWNPAVACDGQFGTVLKAYREWLQCGDPELLERWWPRVKLAMQYGFRRWDSDADGMLDGAQWNTYDLNFYGWNSFCSGLYLAALAAAERMARRVGDEEFAEECRRRLEAGRRNLEEHLWDEELGYYVQKVSLDEHPERQYAKGCLCDQLFGQWWAGTVDLGYVFDRQRVRRALESIYRNNFRRLLAGHRQQPRQFACEDEPGLIITTWPAGGRPKEPMLYCDEIWTSHEYQMAALMLREGMVEPALELVRAARSRYDGVRRNPFNEIECGDHYARPMISWSLLEAATGFFWSAPEQLMRISPALSPDCMRAFFIAGTGWGQIEQLRDDAGQTNAVRCAWGVVSVRRLELGVAAEPAKIEARLDGQPVQVASSEFADSLVRIEFADTVHIHCGQSLTVQMRSE